MMYFNIEPGVLACPLTPTQESIYFDQLRMADSPCYNEGALCEIDIAVDPIVFESTIQAFVSRFDMLTANFISKGDQFFQVFNYFKQVPFSYLDVTTESNSYEYAVNQAQKSFETPYKLGCDRLIDFTLYKVEQKKFLFSIRFHHLVCDAVGLALLVRALDPVYRAIQNGETVEFSDVFSYQNEIEKEIDYLSSKQFKKEKQFWTQKFKQLPSQLLPKKRATKPDVKSHRLTVEMPKNIEQQLKSITHEHKVTFQQIGITALVMLFAKRNSLASVTLGIPVHRRRKHNQKKIFATYTSDLPCTFVFPEKTSVLELFKIVNTELRNNYRYQSYPKASLSRDLGLMDKGREQIADVFFNFQDFATFPILDGHINPLRMSSGFEQDPLHIRMCHYGDAQPIKVNFDFRDEYLSHAEGEVLSGAFIQILKEIAECDIDSDWRDIKTISTQEKAIVKNSASGNIVKNVVNFYQSFIDSSQKNPNSVAVVTQKRHVTYKSLSELTETYRKRFIDSPNNVGSYVFADERDEHFIARLLAGLSLNITYVPIELTQSLHRVQQILDIVKPEICFTGHREILSLFESIKVAGNQTQVSSAYVIFTSGTTGTPKGVSVGSAQLDNFISAMQNLTGISNHHRVLAHTPVSFDIHLLECLLPLSVGACVVLANNNQTRNSEALLQLIEQEQVNFIQATPSLWRMLLDEGLKIDSPTIALSGGEPLTSELAREIAANKKVKLFNVYGPTETTIWSTAQLVEGSSVNIGQPIQNTYCMIVDSLSIPVGVGCTGELLIAGEGVADGYINNEEFNAEKFVLLADLEGVQRRFYRTGDLAQWQLSEGGFANIVYLGRDDEQIKLRGHRIELLEIEHAMMKCLPILACSAFVYEKSSYTKQLIAVFTARKELTVNQGVIEDFKTKLAQNLPYYMIPERIELVVDIPLTMNGKKDKKKLIELIALTMKEQQMRPLTDTESTIVKLWFQLLNDDSISVSSETSFFEIGGNSVLLVRLKSLLLNEFNATLETKDLFELRVLSHLAKAIEDKVTRNRVLNMDKGSITEVEL